MPSISGTRGRLRNPTAVTTALARPARGPPRVAAQPRRARRPVDRDLPLARRLVPAQRTHLGVEDDVLAHPELIRDPVEVAPVLLRPAERARVGELRPEDVGV